MSARNSRREFLGIAAATVAGASRRQERRRPIGRLRAGTAWGHAGAQGQLAGVARVAPGVGTVDPQILRSGKWYRASGGTVQQFEAVYVNLLGAKRCLATASGTTALIVAMHVLDVDAGDEVIVSPFTFIASYNAILLCKALPVLADTDPATLTMAPASIESRITERTRAIMPVHIYGMPCDMDPIMATARERGVAVVEDACQAWLAEYKGRMCGTIGDLGLLQFPELQAPPIRRGRSHHRQQRRPA